MRNPLVIYGLALSALAVAVLVRWFLDPLLLEHLPLVTLFGAVAFAVWLGGTRPALLVMAVGYLVCDYLFIEPRFQFGFASARQAAGSLLYFATSLVIIVVGEVMRRRQHRASEQAELLRITFESVGDAVIATGANGAVTYLNPVAESVTGWKLDDALGQPLDTVFRIVNEQTRKSVENPAARAQRDGIIVGLANHTVLIRKDGAELPIDDSAAPIQDKHGRVAGCVLIFRDISERRRLERENVERAAAARLLASIVESSEDAIISKTLDGTIHTWNAAAERLLGHTAAQAVGRHISLIIPPDRIEEEDQIVAQLRQGKRVEHFDTVRLRSNGEPLEVSLTISPLKDDSGRIVGASKIMRDVTERRAAERQLSASRESLRLTLASIGDAVITTDVEGRITYLNSVAESTTGWNLQDAVGQSLNTVFRILNEQTRMTVEDPTRRALREGVIVGLANHTLLIRKDATERPIDDSAAPIKDEQGRIAGCVLVFRDISGRRAAEKQIQGLMAELREADRRKDEFLAMLAHELRGPLAPMCNMLEIIRRTAGQDKLVQQAHATMDRQLMQLVRLVDDLLDVSRITHNRLELHKERVELSAVVAQAVEMCQTTAERSKHELTVDLPREPIYLHGDPVRLAQVFGNLLNNACKYTEPGGRIWLAGERQGSDVLVSVKDTGIGIPRHMLPHIFDVFTQGDRTLERSQGGLGIGLALAKRLVEMHDGVIEAFSQGPGLGSEFVVRLPLLIETRPAQLPPPPDQELQSPKPRRILVVDDNLDSANSLSRLLQMVGNETFTAHDGLKAVEAAEQFRPEVILLDIGLPTMNGYDTCRRIRSQPWGQKILLIALTGWGQEEDKRQSKEAGFDFHLVKPVKLADLEKLMADAPAEPQRQL